MDRKTHEQFMEEIEEKTSIRGRTKKHFALSEGDKE